MWNIFSCKRHSELASYRLDRELTRSEKIQYSVHWFVCNMCRRFERQLRIIQRTAKELAETEQLDFLSAEAREKIRANINSGI